MEVTITEKENASVVALNGDLDYQSYHDLESSVDVLVGQGRSPIVLDLSAVPHIDSVGLGTIVRLWKTASQKKLALALAGPRKNVRAMINLVNLDGRIKLFDDVDAASG